MRTLMTFVAMISLTVLANLLMKTGAVMGRDGGGAWWQQLTHWRILLGLGSFAAAAVLYIVILRTLPLNVAQSFASAQFVAVILASWIFLSEPIGPAQWAGIALISCGIAIVGWFRG